MNAGRRPASKRLPPIARRAFADDNSGFMKRLIAGLATAAVMSGGLGLAGLGLAGTAQADPTEDWYGPHQWCPGQSMAMPGGPGYNVPWNMHACHTFYNVKYGQGNVTPMIWDGPNPPPLVRTPAPPLWVP
jgi:hypothetical protein